MKKILFTLLISSQLAMGSQPSVTEILKKVDKNRSSEAFEIVSEMIVHGQRFERRIKSKSLIVGSEKAFTEYLSPKREKGTKMLKVDDKVWIYYPQADRIVTIAGHMLKQSVMGSDLSYEDMMENENLSTSYDGIVEKTENFLERKTWKLKLKAKKASSAYQKKEIWVDQERFAILKELYYSSNGTLLKSAVVKEIKPFGKRWYPTSIVFKDELKNGKGTGFLVHSIKFLDNYDSRKFQKRNLRR